MPGSKQGGSKVARANTVLVIDDDAPVRHALARMLTQQGFAMLSSFAPDLPIVVSTAMPMPDQMIGRAPGSRGVGYLQKPYLPSELGEEVRRVIAEMQG